MTHSFNPVPKTIASYSPSAKGSMPSGSQSKVGYNIDNNNNNNHNHNNNSIQNNNRESSITHTHTHTHTTHQRNIFNNVGFQTKPSPKEWKKQQRENKKTFREFQRSKTQTNRQARIH